MTELSHGLSPQSLDRIFPFHFVTDRNLVMTQAGHGLSKLSQTTGVGDHFEGCFKPRRPSTLSTPDDLRRAAPYPVLLEHRKSGVTLRGQFLGLDDDRWLFVGSPWFNSVEELQASRLTLADLGVGDPTVDLLMAGRTQVMAMEDLRRLADLLEQQRLKLSKIEEVYRGAIATADAVPFQENLVTGAFDFIGDGILGISGFSSAEITPGLLESRVVEVSDVPAGELTRAGAASGDPTRRRRDVLLNTRDGRRRWVSESSVLVVDDAGLAKSRIGILMDITRRKQAEKELRRSEAEARQLAVVVSNTQSAVAMGDSERRILWVNPGFSKLFGLELQQVKGKRFRETMVWEEIMESPGDSIRVRLDRGEAVVRELWTKLKDGSRLFLSMEIRPYLDTTEGLRWIFIATDITARRLAEERLQRAEDRSRRLALVAARTDNAVILTDLERRIQWVNEGFTRLTGYSADEAMGLVPGRLLQCPETDVATVGRIRERLSRGEGFECEIRNRRKDGFVYWAHIECQPINDEKGRHSGYMAIESDITARKRYEDRLEQLSSELETILGASPDGYAAIGADGRLSYSNIAFQRMVALDRAHLRGMSLVELDEVLRQVSANRSELASIDAMKPGTSDRMVLEGPGGSIIERTLLEVSTAGGWVKGMVLYLHDVTEQERLNELKSEFLATAAHELRTPMTSIRGFAELLLEERLDSETAREMAGIIHRQTSNLVDMVNELLDLQRIEQGGRRDFDVSSCCLQPLLRDVVQGLRIPGDSRVVVWKGVPADAQWLEVDAAKFSLALTNVLSNAFKYSRGRGDVEISLASRVKNDRDEVGVVVEDHGIGMSESQRSKVFRRFYRADPTGAIPGTGLGMCIVKDIVELHGGQVEVESQLGVGTRVTLWFPRSCSPRVKAATP